MKEKIYMLQDNSKEFNLCGILLTLGGIILSRQPDCFNTGIAFACLGVIYIAIGTVLNIIVNKMNG